MNLNLTQTTKDDIVKSRQRTHLQTTNREIATLSNREIVRQLNGSEEKEEHGRVGNILDIELGISHLYMEWSFRDFIELNIDKALRRLEPAAREPLKEIQESLRTPISIFSLEKRCVFCPPRAKEKKGAR